MLLVVSLVLALLVLEEPWSWLVVALGATLELAETTLFFRWSKRSRAHVGTDALVGRRAVVSADCRPEGQVRIVGEIWRARCASGVGVGTIVVVREVDGLTLVVEPLSEPKLL